MDRVRHQHPRCWHCLKPLTNGTGFQLEWRNGATREVHAVCEPGAVAVLEKMVTPPSVESPKEINGG